MAPACGNASKAWDRALSFEAKKACEETHACSSLSVGVLFSVLRRAPHVASEPPSRFIGVAPQSPRPAAGLLRGLLAPLGGGKSKG